MSRDPTEGGHPNRSGGEHQVASTVPTGAPHLNGQGSEGSGDAAYVLALVERLVAALDAAGVTYCHWKSNEAIARSASGDNDLDLLIARQDAAEFREVLGRLGFCIARPRADRQLPGIVDYYGVDEATARVLHVQAHYQLVLGDDMTKNFRLPVEAEYLSSSVRDGLFPLPSPTFEYGVFVLRMVVKRSPWDAQLDRKGRLTASERRELAYLEERIDPDELRRLVGDCFPFLGPTLFEDCVAAAAERVGRAARAVIAARLLHALRAYGRQSPAVDLGLRMWRRRWQKVQRRVSGATKKKRPDTGGLLVAIVGGDGAGKSSAVEFLGGLLSRDFDLRRYHLGKPPRSRLSRTVKRPMQRLRTFGLFRATRMPPWADFDGAFPGLAFVVWHTLTARDRYREYRRARRAVARGAIAVCDRFPMAAIRLMDGPRTSSLHGLERRPLARWLAEREAKYYALMQGPDVLIVLRVPPDVAVERRPDQDADFVRRRAEEVYVADWTGVNAVVVDAEAPQDQVHAHIRDAVWAAL